MNIVIIGNGIAGITLARHLRKGSEEIKITVISAETEYFFSRTALMYVYMGHMKFEHIKPYEDWFWKKNRIDIVFDRVISINTTSNQLIFQSGHTLPYDTLVLATGSKSRMFAVPNIKSKGVQGLYSYQDLLLMEENTKYSRNAVIVGGGLIGVEMAEMLLSRKIAVTFLIKENRFWGNILTANESRLIRKHLEAHQCILLIEEELKEVIADANGRVQGIITNKDRQVKCDFLAVTIGVEPNIGFVEGSGIDTDCGILVDEYLNTNIYNVYAIGDCAQHRNPPAGRKSIEQVWYTGRMMGETLANTLLGNKTAYHPGPWFNSAKFFDIEYQTYGKVNADTQPGEKQFFWSSENEKVFLTIAYEEASGQLLGINSFGMRMRHELFDRWLREGVNIGHVLANLGEANFDPEFYRCHNKSIIQAFNMQNNTKFKHSKSRFKNIFKR